MFLFGTIDGINNIRQNMRPRNTVLNSVTRYAVKYVGIYIDNSRIYGQFLTERGNIFVP